jgi:hypothetical protein
MVEKVIVLGIIPEKVLASIEEFDITFNSSASVACECEKLRHIGKLRVYTISIVLIEKLHHIRSTIMVNLLIEIENDFVYFKLLCGSYKLCGYVEAVN